ncbi:coiled-coil domain-containing protein 12 [Neocloeon triangulifer]|uniref:coiled-coil domain-containing protein 12 n=1 Tax=Neocloeon triangulifer TaxID=2078957 RepID=UPI00286F9CAC|nr:coiled-coil domain-containing protein 12 [Neocloeon triangulifer]
MAEDGVGQLEADALKRRERLLALKRKREETSEGAEKSEDEIKQEEEGLPKPKFRSYRPQDEVLQDKVIPDAQPGDVEEEVKEQLEAAKNRGIIEELDLTTLAPRKPDWDLKRDVAHKLAKLERRTQRAIAELIRDRLREGQSDLAEAVAMVQPQQLDED